METAGVKNSLVIKTAGVKNSLVMETAGVKNRLQHWGPIAKAANSVTKHPLVPPRVKAYTLFLSSSAISPPPKKKGGLGKPVYSVNPYRLTASYLLRGDRPGGQLFCVMQSLSPLPFFFFFVLADFMSGRSMERWTNGCAKI